MSANEIADMMPQSEWLAAMGVTPWRPTQTAKTIPQRPSRVARSPDYRETMKLRMLAVLPQLGYIESLRTRIEVSAIYWMLAVKDRNVRQRRKMRPLTSGELLEFYAKACGDRARIPKEVEPKSPPIPAHAAGKFPFNRPTEPLSVSLPKIEAMLAPLSDRRKRAAGMFASEGDA